MEVCPLSTELKYMYLYNSFLKVCKEYSFQVFYKNLFAHPINIHVQWMKQRSVIVKQRIPFLSAPCTLINNYLIFYNKAEMSLIGYP